MHPSQIFQFICTTFIKGARIDPVRLKVALQLLPSLTEVTVDKSPQSNKSGFVFTRNGSTNNSLEVLYKLVVVMKNGVTQERYGNITIPEGMLSVTIPRQELQLEMSELLTSGLLSVIPNGNDYLAGEKRSVSF